MKSIFRNGYWGLTKGKFCLQWPYYLPLKLRVLFLPFSFSANFSQCSTHTLSNCTMLCIGFPWQSIKGPYEERKGICRTTLDTLYSLPSKTGALFWSYFTLEYFEYKIFRAEEQCLHSADILTYFREKGGKQESLHGKRISRILSKKFLIFNSYMYVRLDMSLSDFAFLLLSLVSF